MDSRKRYTAAMSGKPADRLPVNYLAGKEVTDSLMQHLGTHSERELLDELGCDFYFLSGRDISQNESMLPFYKGPILEVTEEDRTCPFGIRWKRKKYSNKFTVDNAIEGPFEKGVRIKDILDYNWPKADWFDFEAQLGECEEFSDKVRIGGLWSGIFGDSYRMYGFEHFLLDLLMKPDIIKVLVDRMTDFYMEANERLFRTLGDKMDIFFMGNDFGTQSGLLMDKSIWSEIFYDNYKKLITLAHSCNYRVMVHSCGDIREIIPELIELGVDILDPVQTTANGMEPTRLKKDFGEKIVFHGGVDTQKILPLADPERVKDHILRNISILGKNGKYIVAPSNNFPPGTPVDNILAMYRTAGSLKTLDND